MDRVDYMYAASILFIGIGAALYSPPAGAIVVGIMLAIPPMLSMLSMILTSRREPPK